MEKKKGGKSMKKGSRAVAAAAMAALAAAAVIMAVIGINIVKDTHDKSTYMSELGSMAAKAPEEIQDKTEDEELLKSGIEIPDKQLDFEELKKANKDIFAWIYIPGTAIDYPVLQHPTDDTFYLEHNIDGSAGLPGCIYVELLNGISFNDSNTVLYGHNMLNGSMFATLHRFADKDFFDENRYIFIYTPSADYVYEIFAAYTYSDIHLLKGIDITSEEKFANYLEDVYSVRGMNNNFADDITATGKDKIITLSTCTGDDSKRYLVQGVLLNGREKRIAEDR